MEPLFFAAFFIFLFATFAHCLLPSSSSSSDSRLYIIGTILIQWIINGCLIRNYCPSTSVWDSFVDSFFNTLFPWIFIFYTMFVCLRAWPHWLGVFEKPLGWLYEKNPAAIAKFFWYMYTGTIVIMLSQYSCKLRQCTDADRVTVDYAASATPRESPPPYTPAGQDQPEQEEGNDMGNSDENPYAFTSYPT